MSQIKCLALGLILVAVSALVSSALLFRGASGTSSPSVEDLEFDETNLVVAGAQPGQEVSLSFLVRNRSRRSVRIVGAESGCAPSGCVELPELPVAVPPGGESIVPVTFGCMGPGEFTRTFCIYTDYPGKVIVALAVHGIVEGETPPPVAE